MAKACSSQLLTAAGDLKERAEKGWQSSASAVSYTCLSTSYTHKGKQVPTWVNIFGKLAMLDVTNSVTSELLNKFLYVCNRHKGWMCESCLYPLFMHCDCHSSRCKPQTVMKPISLSKDLSNGVENLCKSWHGKLVLAWVPELLLLGSCYSQWWYCLLALLQHCPQLYTAHCPGGSANCIRVQLCIAFDSIYF